MAGAQRHSSSVAGAKGSSRKVAELPLKVLSISVWGPSGQNASPSPPTRGDVGDDRFGAEGVRTRYSPMRSLPLGLFHLSFGTLI